MKTAEKIAESVADWPLTFIRATDQQDQETEFDEQSIRDLGHEGVVSILVESKQCWVKFKDDSAVTISLFGGVNE